MDQCISLLIWQSEAQTRGQASLDEEDVERTLSTDVLCSHRPQNDMLKWHNRHGSHALSSTFIWFNTHSHMHMESSFGRFRLNKRGWCKLHLCINTKHLHRYEWVADLSIHVDINSTRCFLQTRTYTNWNTSQYRKYEWSNIATKVLVTKEKLHFDSSDLLNQCVWIFRPLGSS